MSRVSIALIGLLCVLGALTLYAAITKAAYHAIDNLSNRQSLSATAASDGEFSLFHLCGSTK